MPDYYNYPSQPQEGWQGGLSGATTGFSTAGIPGAIIGGALGWHNQNKRNQAQQNAQDALNEALAARPVYHHQAELDQNVQLGKSLMSMYDPYTKSSLLPGQQYMQNQIDANSSNTLAKGAREGLSSPSSYTALLGQALDSQNNQQTQMAIAGAGMRQSYQQLYGGATNNTQDANTALANAKDVEFDTNQQQPWLQRVGINRDTLLDSIGRNRNKSDQSNAYAMYSINNLKGQVDGVISDGGGGQQSQGSSILSPDQIMKLAPYAAEAA